MKLFLSLVFAVLALPAVASPAEGGSGDAAPCANEAKLRGICAAVSNRDQTSTGPQKYPYRYTRKIFEASCVDMEKDSDEVIAQKVSAMWAKHSDKLTCTDVSFDVEKGGLIKYAVNAKFDKFIYDVVSWKVDLNKVDASDNKTVLDYVQDQMASYKGLPTEQTLKSYYDLLRKNGAKHRKEL